nr:hypothetical protein [uncultured Tyzzerella sp.]
MNKITTTIFERAYQSYLCGGDVYTYRFESKSSIMTKKYNEAIKYLEDNELVIVKFKSEDKVRLVLTDKGIEYGNSMSV